MNEMAVRVIPRDLFDDLARDQFRWLPALGVGYFEVVGEHYDAAYFENYRTLAETPIAAALNAFRCNLVRSYSSSAAHILDVGVGDGAFLRTAWDRLNRANAKGYDINPAGVAWLREQNAYGDLYAERWPFATFWDSLEHIRNPARALAQVARAAIVSIPIFTSAEHALASKHFKPSEHYWYFTHAGFGAFADRCGFDVVDWSDGESRIGREDIETFVLARR
jgi:hypothetical protein